MRELPTLEAARELDSADPLSRFRSRFHIPQHDGADTMYFTGNSLGLQPKDAKAALEVELDDWAKWGVEGHFQGQHPWVSYHERFVNGLCHLTGAKPHEVVAMNGLTVNLHLLLISFYQPKGTRRKLLCEAKAFPSDRYALCSQIRLHGGNPDTDLIELAPRDGEHLLRTEDVLRAIEDAGEELATVMIGGVNYYTGQLHDMKAITAAAHEAGATCGFDLAHAMGNVHLDLHNWGVDFACWCSYKYLNSGPGAVSGVFIHERHVRQADGTGTAMRRLEGWWGHDAESRFNMDPNFVPMPSAEAWQMSNAPVLNMAVHKVSLDLFQEAGMEALVARSKRLTACLETLVHIVAERTGAHLEILTPTDSQARGCQLSVVAHGYGRSLFDHLMAHGVVVDWREPAVIRMAPVPLYNSFEDMVRFSHVLEAGLTELAGRA
ncbi:MAG: kynureninase [Crocinitomicaceae bacterium TMED45]|nr:MAG: kynureninase [Crocinitomicaceae bacterium TMED45]|tara:strand:+ start:1587 stop:2891 length:1305 start_codon:yes stop_codon:yes gene_type:complete